jgi:hypothetical protein
MAFRLENLMVESRLNDGLAIALDDRKRPVVGVNGLPMPMSTFLWVLMERLIVTNDDPHRMRHEEEHTAAIRMLWGPISMPPVGKMKDPRQAPMAACRAAINLLVDKMCDGSATHANISRLLMDLDEKYYRTTSMAWNEEVKVVRRDRSAIIDPFHKQEQPPVKIGRRDRSDY